MLAWILTSAAKQEILEDQIVYTFFVWEKGLEANESQRVKILRKWQASIPNVSVFVCQILIFDHYHIQNAKDKIQIGVYKINTKE